MSARPLPTLVLELADRTAASYGITRAEILGRERYARITAARYRLWVELRALGYSFPHIGRLFGRDHSTILSGVRRANGLRRKAGVTGYVPVSTAEIPDLFERCAS